MFTLLRLGSALVSDTLVMAVMPLEASVSFCGLCLVDVFWRVDVEYAWQRKPATPGKLGEVIRKSTQISLSWVESHAFELGIAAANEQFLKDLDIHVHMPEGSIDKKGPSAGTAILSAFVSLFTKTKVNTDIGLSPVGSHEMRKMSCFFHGSDDGEISVVGQILPVGGLKEKILATHCADMKRIIAPSANCADIEENVPESVKTGIPFVYVEDIKEALHEVFWGKAVAEQWKETLLVGLLWNEPSPLKLTHSCISL
jgi:ATP-dependent Lon protease